jgi:integrase
MVRLGAASFQQFLIESRFYDLRHAAATLLLFDRMPVKVVSERLGHSNVAITLSIYAHVLPSMQKDAAAIMDRLLG